MVDKRKIPNDIEDCEDKKRVPRQDPVSCQSCRKKKLRCDRQQPCSNCQSRRIACSYTAPSTHQLGYSTPTASMTTATGPRLLSDASVRLPEDVREQEKAAYRLENIMMAPRVSDILPSSDRNQSFTGTSKYSTIPATELMTFLPRESEALAQFQYYVEYVDYLYHAIIPEHVRSHISAMYQSIHNASSAGLSTMPSPIVNFNHLALVFSILAAASYFQNMGSNELQSEKHYREYIDLVAATLTYSDYINCPTVEGIQAAVIIYQFLPVSGQNTSQRALFNFGTLINQCRQMGLFQIDSAQNQSLRKHNKCDHIELEMKRRLAWLVVSSDWFLAYLSGPQEGSYLLNPAHLALDMPANICDDDLCSSGNRIVSLPDHTPTAMSYFLYRVKLSVYCREIVDYTSHERLTGIDIPYHKILELDQKWHQYGKELPDFFQFDNKSIKKYARFYTESPQLVWQRFLIQQGYHSRLCRLHRSYFIRGARDPTYSYSYMMCLQAARRVIEISRMMDEEFPHIPSVSAPWSVMHHVFMAAVILLMDLCFNWDDIMAVRRKEEILEVCRMLDKAQRSSKIVREGIDAMMEILQTRWHTAVDGHGPCLPPEEHLTRTREREVPYPNGEVLHGNADTTTSSRNPLSLGNEGHKLSSASSHAAGDALGLESMWSDFLENSTMLDGNPDEWMDIFSELADHAPTL